MEVRRVWVDGLPRPASGRLVIQLDEDDHRLRRGQLIEAEGWLSAIAPPSNPGGFDARDYWRQRGVFGRLSLPVRGNYEVVGHAPWWSAARWMALKDRCAERICPVAGLGV